MDLTPLIDALAGAVASKLPHPVLVPPGRGLDLWRAYTPQEAARVLGISRSSVYAIPASELGVIHVGPSRANPRILGINLLLYMAGLDPIDIEAVAREQRQAFLDRSPAPITLLNPDQKQRIL